MDFTQVTEPIPVPFNGRPKSDASLIAGTEDRGACVEVRPQFRYNRLVPWH